VVDATSGDPAISIKIAKILSANDISFVDCPVSGGPAGAKEARLTSMMGGSAEARTKAREIISQTFSKYGKVVDVGPVGSAHATKSINNCLNATHLLVAAEGLLALKAFGVEPSVALEVINNSSGRSLQTQKRVPEKVLTRSFDYGFKLGLMHKDVAIANGLLDEHFKSATVMRETMKLLTAAKSRFGLDADYTEIVKELETRAGLSLKM
jgi:3-hydroxyisobutyrate dehydrogenase